MSVRQSILFLQIFSVDASYWFHVSPILYSWVKYKFKKQEKGGSWVTVIPTKNINTKHKHQITPQPWGRTWQLHEAVKTFNYDDTGRWPITSQHCVIKRANITFLCIGMHFIILKNTPVCSAVLTRTSGWQGWRTIQTIWDSFYVQVCQCFGNKLCLWSACCLIFPVEQTNHKLQTNKVSALKMS